MKMLYDLAWVWLGYNRTGKARHPSHTILALSTSSCAAVIRPSRNAASDTSTQIGQRSIPNLKLTPRVCRGLRLPWWCDEAMAMQTEIVPLRGGWTFYITVTTLTKRFIHAFQQPHVLRSYSPHTTIDHAHVKRVNIL